MRNIVIFASGSGSNAENIVNYFANDPLNRVISIFCNWPGAYVLERAGRLGVPVFLFNKKDLVGSRRVLDKLEELGTDLVVLAGFLWMVPGNILEAFPGRVINIHPSLLPAHGGEGMYGKWVHVDVIAEGDRESGITIHLVNERYDEGDIIFQARCDVTFRDTPESLAAKIHDLEQAYFPGVIEDLLDKLGKRH
ncbi:MAG: phosphoribosylglycinamide formyltransferase [Odoribacteraceae bacterium]|nr:phosphoribosylglycinamide formyltransferase [Odoribacteraceae bacterium]